MHELNDETNLLGGASVTVPPHGFFVGMDAHHLVTRCTAPHRQRDKKADTGPPNRANDAQSYHARITQAMRRVTHPNQADMAQWIPFYLNRNMSVMSYYGKRTSALFIHPEHPISTFPHNTASLNKQPMLRGSRQYIPTCG